MYCSECGAQAAGKFCSHCGTPLARSGAEPAAADWRQSLDYDLVTSVPEVRTRMERAAAQASQQVSGSQLLNLIDTIATPLTGGISSLAMAKVAQPITARLGVKTDKERQETVLLPTGVVLANLAVALAAGGHKAVGCEHNAQQCTVEASVDADLRAMEGKLRVTVARGAGGTDVSARALIEGQWYDWGKCNKRLDELFAALRAAA